MKRLYISLGILLLLGILSGLHVWKLDRYTTQLIRQLEVAEKQLEQEAWSDAATLLTTTYNDWEAEAFYLHTTLRHDDIDAIRTSFREAIAYMNSQEDAAECSAVLSRLRNQLELLIEAELPTIKNLL